MESLFSECISLSYLPDISKWRTDNISNMSYSFYYCSSLIFLPDISQWNTKNVKNINFIFQNCSSLTSIPNISKWNVNNISNANSIFIGCSSLNILPDISIWKIKSDKIVNDLFYRDSAFQSDKSIDIILNKPTASIISNNDGSYNSSCLEDFHYNISDELFIKDNQNEEYYENFYK